MSSQKVKIKTIIDEFFTSSYLSNKSLIKKMNFLIDKHNSQVSAGKIKEEKIKRIENEQQLSCWIGIRRKIFSCYQDTEIEIFLKQKYRDGANYIFVSNEMNMSQGKYYYMLNKIYDEFNKELCKCGYVYDKNSTNADSNVFPVVEQVIIERENKQIVYDVLNCEVLENKYILTLNEMKLSFLFNKRIERHLWKIL